MILPVFASLRTSTDPIRRRQDLRAHEEQTYSYLRQSVAPNGIVLDSDLRGTLSAAIGLPVYDIVKNEKYDI